MQYIKLHFKQQEPRNLLIDAYRMGVNIPIEVRGTSYLFRVRAIDPDENFAIVDSAASNGVFPKPQLRAHLVGGVGWVATTLED